MATKLTLAAEPDAVVAYVDPGSEHPDNERFLVDCEAWFGEDTDRRPQLGLRIVRLRSDNYADTWDVWRRRRFIVGPQGAPCTAELKKAVRYRFERSDDVQVFGYTAEEAHRADRFREQNPGVDLVTPLIDHGLTKADCLAMVDRAGIELPVMYRLGYRNNNCIGCPKGGMGYWNKIRRDFPATFDRMADLERDIGHAVLSEQTAGRTVPVWLDELDPDRGVHADDPDMDCSLLCALAEDDYS